MLDHLTRNAQDLYRAANIKYNEGLALLQQDFPLGGHYLLGYALEMGAKAVIAETGGSLFQGSSGKKALKNDFGHNLNDLLEGMKFYLADFQAGEYRELLDVFKEGAQETLSKWRVEWRYLEGIDELETNQGGLQEKFQVVTYDLFLAIRSILIDLQARRTANATDETA